MTKTAGTKNTGTKYAGRSLKKDRSDDYQCFTDLVKVEQVLQQIADELGDIDMELTAHLVDVCILSLRDEADALLYPRGSC